MDTTSPSRREFLGTAAGGALALSAASASRVFGANDRIHMGVIGCGGMGTGHLNGLVKRSEADNIKVLAVCDVYQRRLTRAKKISGTDGHLDYRKVIDDKAVDAVLIATPDHWHGKLSIDSVEAGKHVYCEKPLTHTVEQAIAVRDAVRKTKKILQVGPNATADDGYWQAREAVKAGRIGQVTWAQGSYNRNARECLFNTHQKIDPAAGPGKDGDDFIDWDMWLGHKHGLAPKIDFNAEHFFRFRKYWPYNGGVATDLLYHKLAPLLITLAGPDGAYPTRVSAAGGLYVEKDGRDIPDTFLLTLDYPQFSVFLVSTLTNDTQLPDRVYGKHGTMDLGGQPLLKFNGDFKEEFKSKNDGKEEVRLAVKLRRDMVGNFLDVIRGNGTLHCNVELGAATMVAIKLGVESFRQRKMMTWDAKTEKAGELTMNRTLATLVLLILAPLTAAADNELTEKEKADGWVLLFDGKTLDGWTTSAGKASKTPVEDGSINPHKCGHYMMVHKEQWENYVLSLDFKIGKGCNSGVFIRTSSLTPRPGKDVGFNGLEVAIDDTTGAGFHDTGAIYDLVKPSKNAAKPAGEWNRLVVTSNKNKIEVELNGETVARMDTGEWAKPNVRPDGTAHKFDVAYKDHPVKGYIGLQDHGSACWFKNIKIKPLK